MRTRRIPALAAAAALLLVPLLPPTAIAAGPHGHGGHAAASGAPELTLDDGRKWETDAPLRQGMDEMRHALAAALPRIHEGAFSPADYATLAGAVERQVDEVTTKCRLAPEADMQLHVVLAQIIEGIDEMQHGAQQQDGAVRVAQALDAYAEHFDHPDWKPLLD